MRLARVLKIVYRIGSSSTSDESDAALAGVTLKDELAKEAVETFLE
jgi:hypothetical protein